MTDPYMNDPERMRARISDQSRRTMANASLILGVLALATIIFVYTPYIFGGTAIVLALLSRGSAPKCPRMARVGMLLSVCALIIITFVFISVIFYVLSNYGSFEAFYTDYMDKYSYTMQQLMNSYQ